LATAFKLKPSFQGFTILCRIGEACDNQDSDLFEKKLEPDPRHLKNPSNCSEGQRTGVGMCGTALDRDRYSGIQTKNTVKIAYVP
jgi:hypothetical protein